MSEWTFVGAAYGLTWVVLAGYAAYLLRRARRARAAYENAPRSGKEVR